MQVESINFHMAVHQEYRQMNSFFSPIAASVAKGLQSEDSHPRRGWKDACLEYGSIETMDKIWYVGKTETLNLNSKQQLTNLQGQLCKHSLSS